MIAFQDEKKLSVGYIHLFEEHLFSCFFSAQFY